MSVIKGCYCLETTIFCSWSHSIQSQSRQVLVSVLCELLSWSPVDHWLLNPNHVI